MIRKLGFKDGIVSGYNMRDLLKVFPALENKFEQRHNFDEYYFSEVEVEINIKQLDQLSNLFAIKIDWSSIVLIE